MANEKSNTVKARVVGVNYGQSQRGETVEVTERELARVGPLVLMSIADEAKARESATAPILDAARVARDKARRAKWTEMRETSERMIREQHVAMAKAVVASGGAPAGKP